ncbi:hypothetical protein AB0I81_17715, partial [Nonomuraea sp. NPDC050404]|uniref:hypothetical protein n=1 Tax=Nonomuraea sp. NPDC050404 TaxID=3155783 RepID=UPI0033E35748
RSFTVMCAKPPCAVRPVLFGYPLVLPQLQLVLQVPEVLQLQQLEVLQLLEVASMASSPRSLRTWISKVSPSSATISRARSVTLIRVKPPRAVRLSSRAQCFRDWVIAP